MDSAGTHALDAIHSDAAARGWVMDLTHPEARGPLRLLRFAADRRRPSMTVGQDWDQALW